MEAIEKAEAALAKVDEEIKRAKEAGRKAGDLRFRRILITDHIRYLRSTNRGKQ